MSNDRSLVGVVVKAAREQGFTTKPTKKGLMILGKNPEDGSVLIHGSDSDVRAWRNAKARLKRLGLIL